VRFVLGIDIGGTNLVVGSVAEDGSVLHALGTEPTHAEAGQSDVLDRLIALAKRTLEQTRREIGEAEILGVGVGAPGPLDTKSGIVLLTPNLGWVNLPLRQIIHERLGLPAVLDNDANWALPEAPVTPSASPSVLVSAEELSSMGSCITGPLTAPARSATPRSTPKADAVSAGTMVVWRRMPRAPTSRCGRSRRSLREQ
jgi:hypothetical protein